MGVRIMEEQEWEASLESQGMGVRRKGTERLRRDRRNGDKEWALGGRV